MALSQQRVQALACRAQPLLDLLKGDGVAPKSVVSQRLLTLVCTCCCDCLLCIEHTGNLPSLIQIPCSLLGKAPPPLAYPLKL